MPNQPSRPDQKQIERAKKLRQQIESLKKGPPGDDKHTETEDDAGKEQTKSLKEQIRGREAQRRKSDDAG